MPRFLFIANFSAPAAKAILATGGSARRLAIEQLLADVGGTVESFDFAFGSDDAYVIADLPDAATAAAVTLSISGSGTAEVRTIVLVTPEEMDAAAQVRPDYRSKAGCAPPVEPQ